MNHWIVIVPGQKGNCLNLTPFETEQYEKLYCAEACAYVQRKDKFVNDQVFTCDDKGILISDGVLLNLAELKRDYHTDNLTRIVSAACEETNGIFFKKFAGPFLGAVYDRSSGVLTAYANQTGDTMVFYHSSVVCSVVSNDLNLIETLMRSSGISRSLDEQAAKYLLTFGYMVDGRTLFSQIKRVLPGEYVTIHNGVASRSRYHRFSFEEKEVPFQEAVEMVDAGFRKAVERCFEKDREYGCPEHLVDMSGGFDSRMTAWVAHDMGYIPAVYVNYCQSGTDELHCASRVAAVLEGQFYHKQLDDASFLYDMDKLVDLNYGLSICFGSTGNEQMLRTLNLQRFGLEHTGQIGDAVVGAFSHGGETPAANQHNFKYSRMIECEAPEEVLSACRTYDEFGIYTRAFLGALSSHLIRRNYTYQVSPFMDPDFMELCMSLPLEHRREHKLYWAWLDTKYPEAAKLPSTHVRSSVATFMKRVQNYAIRKVGSMIRKTGLSGKGPVPNNMNPFDYWYETMPRMRSFVTSYYQEARPLLEGYPELEKAVDRMYRSERTMDKLMALNLLAAVKRYFA